MARTERKAAEGGHDGGVQPDAGDARELPVRDLHRQLPVPGDGLRPVVPAG
jgi:hypothetical protein